MNQADHADTNHRHLANLQLVRILDDPIHRGANVGTFEIELRLVHRGLGLRDLRLIAPRRDRGIGVGGTRPRIGQLSLGRAHLVQGIVIIGARREALVQQHLLAVQRVLLDREIGLRAGNVAAGPGRRGPQHLRL